MQTKLNWQKIYLDYSPKLLGICHRYIADLQAAEDIVGQFYDGNSEELSVKK